MCKENIMNVVGLLIKNKDDEYRLRVLKNLFNTLPHWQPYLGEVLLEYAHLDRDGYYYLLDYCYNDPNLTVFPERKLKEEVAKTIFEFKNSFKDIYKDPKNYCAPVFIYHPSPINIIQEAHATNNHECVFLTLIYRPTIFDKVVKELGVKAVRNLINRLKNYDKTFAEGMRKVDLTSVLNNPETYIYRHIKKHKFDRLLERLTSERSLVPTFFTFLELTYPMYNDEYIELVTRAIRDGYGKTLKQLGKYYLRLTNKEYFNRILTHTAVSLGIDSIRRWFPVNQLEPITA